ncbi:MAG: trehalose-6-phosphate synthase, partial [Candidatus Omnitrophota bacterium]
IAAHIEKKGVLILSQFTGAAREFSKEAVLVNPYDPDGFADAMKYAIEMSSKEKKERMEKMREFLEENNIYRWAGKFISNLLKLE